MAELLIAGDFCPGPHTAEIIDRGDVAKLFGTFSDDLAAANYRIVNLEAPIADEETPRLRKIGPCLKASPRTVDFLKAAGFDLVTLANNHLLDRCGIGVRNTLDRCRELGIDTVGGGVSLADAEKIFYRRIDGIDFAFINVCENEFSIAGKESPGANPLDPIRNIHQIKAAREQAQRVIVIVHGGLEFFRYPTIRERDLFRFFVENGADAVINHHTHCFRGYEIFRGAPIFYSLGNFSFENPRFSNSDWNRGFVAMLAFQAEGAAKVRLLPYIQGEAGNPGISRCEGRERERFDEEIANLSGEFDDSDLLESKHLEFLEQNCGRLLEVLEPSMDRISAKLRRMKLLPSLADKRKRLLMLNLVRCETHRDSLVELLSADYRKSKNHLE